MPAEVGSGTRANSRPLDVQQIAKEAENYEYNPNVPLKLWLRTAATLLHEVRAISEQKVVTELIKTSGKHL